MGPWSYSPAPATGRRACAPLPWQDVTRAMRIAVISDLHIGAGVGALFGGFRRMRWAEEEQQQQQSYQMQQQSSLAHGHANYNRAFGACMAGRGYTVS